MRVVETGDVVGAGIGSYTAAGVIARGMKDFFG